MRRKIIAGNWKMNNNLSETTSLVDSIIKNNSDNKNCEVYLSPSFPFLRDSNIKCKKSNIKILAQNISHMSKGALTGEVSTEMLESIEVKSVIVGHSERRTIFNENDELLLKKLEQCFKNNFEVFFCIGEDFNSRKSNKEYSVIEDQLKSTIFNLKDINPEKLIIAYEPVWAIGTGLSASPNQAQEMHNFIRQKFKNKYSLLISDNLPIIYGGSIKPETAKDIFSQADVDGGLIGGASLNADSFSKIINSI
jgi:triosephosphate isomerase